MVALQIEQQYGSSGAEHIQSRLQYFEEQNDDAAVALWRDIGSMFEALNPTGIEK